MYEIITKELIRSILPLREQNSNKGDFGKVLNIVSSEQYVGAGFLASVSALKVGAGYSIFCSCENIINKHIMYAPELLQISHGNFEFERIKNIIEKDNISSVVLGCGIGINDKTISFVKDVIEYLKNTNIPCIIDADGLNCLAKLENIILNKNFILSPHPKELSRLLNIEVEEIQKNREYHAIKAAEKYHSTIILKGHETLIADYDGNIYKNVTGNSALAKSGTGDVLSGMIGGFLAQKTTTTNAGILSVYLHGLAAEIYSNEYNEYSMLASDLLKYIPIAIKLCK